MDAAIVLAVLAGFFWAANIVIVRWALDRRSTTPLAAAVVAVGVGALVALTVAVASGQDVPGGGDLWRYALVGAIAPGSSQGYLSLGGKKTKGCELLGNYRKRVYNFHNYHI